MDRPAGMRIPSGMPEYDYPNQSSLQQSPSTSLIRPDQTYQTHYDPSALLFTAGSNPVGIQQPSASPFAFSSQPPLQPPSANAPVSPYQPVSGSSSSHSHVKYTSEKDEGDSDDMEEPDDVERKPSPVSGSGEVDNSPKKKQRVMLARGRACVTCRNRKLKCSGERPCSACAKADTDCRYEEIQKKKPRHVLMEERVLELESLMISRGEQPPPSQLTTCTPTKAHGVPDPSPIKEESGASGSSRLSASRPRTNHKVSAASVNRHRTPPASAPVISQSLPSSSDPADTPRPMSSRSESQPHSNHLALSLHSHRDISTAMLVPPLNLPAIDIQPRSPLEHQLISFVLPYTPFLALPLHPQRLLALLTLDPSDPSRPHPALLCVLFAEAIRLLEYGIPPPKHQIAPGFPSFASSMPPPTSDLDKAWLLSQVRGSSLVYLERARTELDNGIRNVDRPFDLVRAAIGIARYLYSLGRFIEGWNIPIARLAVSCGLHRLTGNITRPHTLSATGEHAPTEYMPLPYAPTQFYLHHNDLTSLPQQLPALRMRPVILPPPRDDIDLAERVKTLWAAKAQDWSAGVGWGWSVSMEDEECTTEWPWGLGVPEPKGLAQNHHRFGIRDLFDVNSQMHISPFSDSTYVLGIKSMCLLNRASHLNDLPESSIPYLRPDGRLLPDHIPPVHKVRLVETAIAIFRQRLPAEYAFPPPAPMQLGPNGNGDSTGYLAMSDPWYILLHVNLYTAEMLTWREMSHYDVAAYHRAVASAREVVRLVSGIRSDDWVHVDMVVAINLSLVARMLYREADRLQTLGQVLGAKMASDEAEYLRSTLAGDYARWMPMAGLQALIVGRVREGLAEKEGEYERV